MHYRRTSKSPSEKMAPCGCCALRSAGNEPQIDESEICNGYSRKKKKPRPKKEKCPVNGTHEWYKEWTTEEYTFGFNRNYKLIRWSEDVLQFTCIHCWKVKTKRVRASWSGTDSWRNRKRTLPKRPVQF